MRGPPGVKQHTDHKPRNTLPSGLAEELARTHNYIIQQIYLSACMYVYVYVHMYLCAIACVYIHKYEILYMKVNKELAPRSRSAQGCGTTPSALRLRLVLQHFFLAF